MFPGKLAGREAHGRPDDDEDDEEYAEDAKTDALLASTASTPSCLTAALHPRGRGARRRQAVIHVEAVAGELRKFRHVLPEQGSPLLRRDQALMR